MTSCAPASPALRDARTVGLKPIAYRVEFETTRSLRPGMFVAQVVGQSMEPRIPDGAYCLFASPVTGTRQGRTVLVPLRDALDPGTGERFTVKRHRGEKTDDEGSVAVVVAVVEVIVSEPPA